MKKPERGKHTPVPRNSPCPCGSGKKYKRCCIVKALRWEVDDDGNVYRVVPIHPELKPYLERHRQRFVATFGREPCPDDPFMFEGRTTREIETEMVNVMIKVGIEPAKIYAYQKTGLLPTEYNRDLIPDRDLQEWNDAVDEYHRAKPSPNIAAGARHFLNAVAQLPEQLDIADIFLSRIVSEHGVARNVRARKNRKIHSFHDFALFCATKALKTVRAVRKLIESGHGEDALILVRSIYETYLMLIHTLAHPADINSFVAAKIGLETGEYTLDRRTREIRERTTGATVGRAISVRSMARQSPFPEDASIYDFLYRYLSQYTHGTFLTIEAYLDGDRFDGSGSKKLPHAAIYSLFTVILILDLYSLFRPLDDRFRRDLTAFVRRVKRQLADVFMHMNGQDGSKRVPGRLVRRLQRRTSYWLVKAASHIDPSTC